jgi:hypothetical protein
MTKIRNRSPHICHSLCFYFFGWFFFPVGLRRASFLVVLDDRRTQTICKIPYLRCSTPMRPCRSPISSPLCIPISPQTQSQDGGARACPSHGLPDRTCHRHGHLARGRSGHTAWPRQVERWWSSCSHAPTDFVLPRSGEGDHWKYRRPPLHRPEQRELGGCRRWKRSAWSVPDVGASTCAGRGRASSRCRRGCTGPSARLDGLQSPAPALATISWLEQKRGREGNRWRGSYVYFHRI